MHIAGWIVIGVVGVIIIGGALLFTGCGVDETDKERETSNSETPRDSKEKAEQAVEEMLSDIEEVNLIDEEIKDYISGNKQVEKGKSLADLISELNERRAKLCEDLEERKKIVEEYNNSNPDKTVEIPELPNLEESPYEKKNPSDLHLSSSAAKLLSDMEAPVSDNYIKYDDEGNIIAIRNHDIGDGGITVGFGTYVEHNDIEKQKELMDKYRVDATNTDEWLPIDVATKIYSDSMSQYEKRVSNWAENNGYELTQQEFDALVIQAYNGWYSSMAEAYMDYSKLDEEVVQSVLDVYRNMSGWSKYGKGWENRVRATLDVLRHGDYEKNY